MPTAVIYTRVSTVEQVDGKSLIVQQNDCRSYCDRNGWFVIEVFEEQGESATTANRTELKRMLARICKKDSGVDFVVVHDVSRFSRNTNDYHVLKTQISKYGIELRSVAQPIDDSSVGRFVENLFASIAQLDNDLRRDKTIGGMQEVVRDGGWPWQPPLGYKSNPSGGRPPIPAVDTDVAHLITKCFELMASGLYSKEEVLAKVSAQGLTTRRGKRMGPQQFDRLLRNEFYAGLVSAPRWNLRAKGRHVPLVDSELFRSVQVVLAGRRPNVSTMSRDRVEFPLRRFVDCGRCGTPLTASFATGKQGKRYPYYQCRRRGCSNLVTKQSLEDLFLEALTDLTPRTEIWEVFCSVLLDSLRIRLQEATNEKEIRDQRLSELSRKQDKASDLLVDGVITAEVYKRQLAKLNEEMLAVPMADRTINMTGFSFEKLYQPAAAILFNLADSWVNADLKAKHRIQATVFPGKLAYLEGKLETRETSILFKELSRFSNASEHLASPTGFEPVLPP